MGPKDAPASTHRPRRLPYPPRLRLHFRTRVHTSPASPSVPPTKNSPFRRMTSAPAPSAFTLPLHRLPRPPRSNRPPAAAVIHNGLSTEKLSTSLPAALCKTFSPSRLRTRIYNISFARRPLPGSVRAVVPPCPAPPYAGWGRAKAKADASSCSAEHAACVPNHCVQRRKCTRPTPPLPVRSPRGSLSTAAPLPAYGRTAVCKGGSAPGQPRPCPCVLPATACLRPRPRRLNGHPASAGGRENDRMAHRRTTTPTH